MCACASCAAGVERHTSPNGSYFTNQSHRKPSSLSDCTNDYDEDYDDDVAFAGDGRSAVNVNETHCLMCPLNFAVNKVIGSGVPPSLSPPLLNRNSVEMITEVPHNIYSLIDSTTRDGHRLALIPQDDIMSSTKTTYSPKPEERSNNVQPGNNGCKLTDEQPQDLCVRRTATETLRSQEPTATSSEQRVQLRPSEGEFK